MMLFLLIVLGINLCNVKCLSCLTCQGIIQPRHCRFVKECGPTETHCVSDRVLDQHGQRVYNLGCRSDKICANVSMNIDESCRECCTTDLCNADACGQPGYPTDRGPICYDCQLYPEGAQCKDIAFCQTNEVCYFRSRYEFGDELFIRGCADKDSCNPDIAPVVVGRRSSDTRDLQFHCNRCCSADLCNYNCDVDTLLAADCYDVLHVFGKKTSGIYVITLPNPSRTVSVYCDMDTSGGGWTVFQHRASADVDFYRNMSEYVKGFGNLSGNFWLGLEYVYEMTTSHNSTLYLKIEAADGTWLDVQYDNFSLSSGPDYTLNIGTRHGPAMSDNKTLEYHNGCPFSTYDVDKSLSSCASKFQTGGWWFKSCFTLDLNGIYTTPGTVNGDTVLHLGFRQYESLKQTNMMFRRS